MKNIDQIRKEYTKHSLDETDVDKSPFLQFNKWFEEAVKSDVAEPNAMTLATVYKQQPDSRIVLLKGVEENEFRFFTNYASDKGMHIEQNSRVSLCFFWKELERQVKINGTAAKINKKDSLEYFSSRPHASQIGALASNQSEEVPNREFLDLKFRKLEAKYANSEVPMPESWGGYDVSPVYFEFWQGRRSRLHDRIVYEKNENSWNIKRLSP